MKVLIAAIFLLAFERAHAIPVTYTFFADNFINLAERLPEYQGAGLPVPFKRLAGSYTLDEGTLIDFRLRVGEALFMEDGIEFKWYGQYYVFDSTKDSEWASTHMTDGFRLWVEPPWPGYTEMMYAYREVESLFVTKDLSINQSPFPWVTDSSGIYLVDFGEGWAPFKLGTSFRRRPFEIHTYALITSQFHDASLFYSPERYHPVPESHSLHLLALGLLAMISSCFLLKAGKAKRMIVGPALPCTS